MGQNQVGQNRLVKAYCAVLDETLQVLLESAVGKLGAENLVLPEEQKEDRRRHPNYGEGFGKSAREGAGHFAHQALRPSS
jgi:hypothetical protein